MTTRDGIVVIILSLFLTSALEAQAQNAFVDTLSLNVLLKAGNKDTQINLADGTTIKCQLIELNSDSLIVRLNKGKKLKSIALGDIHHISFMIGKKRAGGLVPWALILGTLSGLCWICLLKSY